MFIFWWECCVIETFWWYELYAWRREHAAVASQSSVWQSSSSVFAFNLFNISEDYYVTSPEKNTISNAKYSCIFPQNIPQKSGLKVSPPKKPGLKLQERMKYQGLWAHFWCLHGFSWLLQQLAASAELRLRRVERVKTTDLAVQLWATERRSGQLRDEVTYSGFHVFFGEPWSVYSWFMSLYVDLCWCWFSISSTLMQVAWCDFVFVNVL
jgi:hypothetical protein